MASVFKLGGAWPSSSARATPESWTCESASSSKATSSASPASRSCRDPVEMSLRDLAQFDDDGQRLRRPRMRSSTASARPRSTPTFVRLGLEAHRGPTAAAATCSPRRAPGCCRRTHGARHDAPADGDLARRCGRAGGLCRDAALLGLQVWPHRLASGFPSDVIHVSGKTGTWPGIRNEVGVVEYADGGRYAVAVFTSTERQAATAPEIDACDRHRRRGSPSTSCVADEWRRGESNPYLGRAKAACSRYHYAPGTASA